MVFTEFDGWLSSPRPADPTPSPQSTWNPPPPPGVLPRPAARSSMQDAHPRLHQLSEDKLSGAADLAPTDAAQFSVSATAVAALPATAKNDSLFSLACHAVPLARAIEQCLQTMARLAPLPGQSWEHQEAALHPLLEELCTHWHRLQAELNKPASLAALTLTERLAFQFPGGVGILTALPDYMRRLDRFIKVVYDRAMLLQPDYTGRGQLPLEVPALSDEQIMCRQREDMAAMLDKTLGRLSRFLEMVTSQMPGLPPDQAIPDLPEWRPGCGEAFAALDAMVGYMNDATVLADVVPASQRALLDEAIARINAGAMLTLNQADSLRTVLQGIAKEVEQGLAQAHAKPAVPPRLGPWS